MSAPLSSDLQRRKKEVIMAEGYEIDCFLSSRTRNLVKNPAYIRETLT